MFMDADGPAAERQRYMDEVLGVLWHVVSRDGRYYGLLHKLLRTSRPGMGTRFHRFCEWIDLLLRRQGCAFEARDPACARGAREASALAQESATLEEVLPSLPADIVSHVMAQRCSAICHRPVPLKEWEDAIVRLPGSSLPSWRRG